MSFDPNTPLTRENFADLPPLCSDGAWGTELQNRGVPSGYLCDLWNLERPDKVREVAQTYVDAGAQIVITNTFSSSRILLAQHGRQADAAEIAKAGARLSREAAEGRAYVFASIGPCGKMVMMGEIDPAEVESSAAEQAAAMAEGGAHAIVIETQSDLVEAEALLKGALAGCDLPVGVSFTFDAGADNDRTMMGVSIEQAKEMALRAGASFVGSNCGKGIDTFPAIAQAYADCPGDLPVWIKGNAGLPKVDSEGNTYFDAQPDLFAATVGPLLDAGARFVGGCCGSTPEHIRAMAQALAQRNA